MVCPWSPLKLTGFSSSALRAPLNEDDGNDMDDLQDALNPEYQGGDVWASSSLLDGSVSNYQCFLL